MNVSWTRLGYVAAALALLCAPLHADTAQPETAKVVSAANAFLATLDQGQRDKLLFKFDDEKQRAHWSNLPDMAVHRSGLSMGSLSEPQRSAAMNLLAATLSHSGFEKVQQIMDADEVLKSQPNRGPGGGGGPRDGRPRDGGGPGGPPDRGGRGPGGGGPGGGGAMFGKDLYFISILGTPSDKDPWMLQFGGHHLGLNITIAGDRGVLTPSMIGAQPALYESNGKTIRPMGRESDKAFDLLNALDDGQRKQAILNYRVADLVLGPGRDGKTIQPEGLKASAMNEKQRAMLLDLISEWSGIVGDSYASQRMEEIKAGMDDTWFAWSGPTTHEPGKSGTAYYRIQGPKLVIEYAPQRLGGDLTMHLHTMYRDPTNDYGRGLSSK